MAHTNSERGTATDGATDPVVDVGRAYLSIHIALIVMCMLATIAAF